MLAALIIGLLTFFTYTILAINTAAIAKHNYRGAFVTCMLFMIVNFFFLRHVAEANSMIEFIGYMVGGLGGDMMGIYISKRTSK